MEPAFWTLGPVPIRLLDALAMPRKKAQAACLEALKRDGHATLGGPSGCGRSTLAHQVASKWHHAAVVLDAQAAPHHDERAWAQEVLMARGAKVPTEPSWQDVARRIRSPVLFIVDHLDGEPEWLPTLQETVPGAFLVIRPDGAVRPEELPRSLCRSFLAKRSGTPWEPDALELVLDLAEGRPDVLQQMGHAALHGRPETVTQERVLEAAAQVAHHLPHSYAERLSRLSPARKALLRAMVLHPEETPTQWAKRANLPSRSAPVHLQRLVQEDRLVERTERGRYRPASPLLTWHVQATHASPVYIYRPR